MLQEEKQIISNNFGILAHTACSHCDDLNRKHFAQKHLEPSVFCFTTDMLMGSKLYTILVNYWKLLTDFENNKNTENPNKFLNNWSRII